MVDAMRRAARHAALIGVAGALLTLPPGVVSAQASGGAALQLAQAGPGSRGAPAAPQAGGSDTDRQMADLKKQLKITPQQEPQFNAFAEAMRSNDQELDSLARQQGAATPNAVEGLKRAQQLAEAQASGLKRLVPPMQALYDSLSDPQKKIADQLLGGGGPEAGGAPGGPPPGGRKR
jgi:periplasmic protein CpxP/Spy